MATDTTKITGAADELSAGLAKGGTAAKTLGVEIANAIKSLDTRVSAIEAGGGGGTQPPIEPPIQPPTGATGGVITDFTQTPGQNFKIDGRAYCVDTAGKSHSMTSPDNKTLRFEVRSGENWTAHDSSSVNRSEADGAPSIIPYGGIIKLAYKLRIEPGGSNTASWCVIGQFHNDDKGRAQELGLSQIQWTSPPFAMELYGEKFSIVLRHCPSDKDPQNGAGNIKEVRAWTASAPVERGRTYEVKWEIKPVNDSSGYLYLRIDNVEVCAYHGPVGYGPWGVYWEFGVYREQNSTPLAATYQNVTLG